MFLFQQCTCGPNNENNKLNSLHFITLLALTIQSRKFLLAIKDGISFALKNILNGYYLLWKGDF